MRKCIKYIPLTSWIVGTLACFCFLFGYYPYHLFHKEQLMLFLPGESYPDSGNVWMDSFHYAGDFLTQFYYYTGGGPTILTLCLALTGLFMYLLVAAVFRRINLPQWPAILIAMVLCGSELWLECSTHYPLAYSLILLTITLVAYLLHSLFAGGRIYQVIWLMVVLAGLVFQCTRLTADTYEGLDLRLENFYAIDSEAYFNNWEKVEQLTREDLGNYVSSYYHNLAQARKGKLAEGLLNYYRENTRSLLIPVREKESSFSIAAAGEAWFQMGDMTMAEHATLLGMIFSRHHTGSRAIRRLAEINLIQGETAAAEKYLHMLSKSQPHRKWAEEHTPGKQTASVAQFISRKKQQLPTSDTIRLAGQNRASLLNLVQSNPGNSLARDYLLCQDLLTKNLHAFAVDYMNYANGIYTPLYAQAMLIVKSVEPELLANCQMPMNNDILQQQQAYLSQYQKNQGKASAMAAFRNTYWYYYHYEKLDQ